MKIAYLATHNLGLNDGITKKFQGQLNAWKNDGHEVMLFCTTPIIRDSIVEWAQLYQHQGSILNRLQFNHELYQDLEKFNPDIIYLRYDSWGVTLDKILRKFNVVVELNTMDIAEQRLLMKRDKSLNSLFRYLIYMIMRNRVLSKVKGIIGVTKELIEHKSFSKFNILSTYIPNGIDLESFPTLKNKSKLNQKIGLFFIGSPLAPWHGEEYIKRMAENMPEFDFHIVGLKENNKSNLFWYDFMSKSEYLPILEKCHICISTLALYKKSMEEACPLKAREYMAYGYPMIFGYKETAFIDKEIPSWAYYINCQKPIDYSKLKIFILEKYKTVVSQSEIKHIDTGYLEQKRLIFFKEIYNRTIS